MNYDFKKAYDYAANVSIENLFKINENFYYNNQCIGLRRMCRAVKCEL